MNWVTDRRFWPAPTNCWRVKVTNEINTTDAANLARRKRGSSTDPVLTELWAIKRQINEEANFSLDAIAKCARTFTIEAAHARVRSALNATTLKSRH